MPADALSPADSMKMTTALMRFSLSKLAALVALVVPLAAHATLGEGLESVESDRLAIQATERILPSTHYTVHEFLTPAGATIKEFVSGQGIVFAIAWRGPVMPDLRLLMGTYFEHYLQAATAKPINRRSLTVADANLVVTSTGQMRAFSGQAYIPMQLPAGVTPEELR
jgi:hypothetical protein